MIGSIIAEELAQTNRGKYEYAFNAASRILAERGIIRSIGSSGSSNNLDDLAARALPEDAVMGEEASRPAREGERIAVEEISKLSQSMQVELVAPLVQLMTEMPFYQLHGNSTQVVVLDANSPISLAFIAAQESRVSSVLLHDETKGGFSGLLTVTDYIRILLHCNEHPEAAEAIASQTVAEVKKADFLKEDTRREGGTSMPSPTSFICGGIEESLFTALDRMIKNSVNRLPIVAGNEGGDSATHAAALETARGSTKNTSPFAIVSVLTFPQLLSHVATVLLTSSVSNLASPFTSPNPSATASFNASGFSSLFEVPLAALDVGKNLYAQEKETMAVVRQSDTVAFALTMMLQHGVSALAIQDDTGLIIDVISRSDVLRIESCGTYDVTQTLQEGLKFREAFRAIVCCLNDTFGDVMAHFVTTKVKEMFVVDPVQQKVIGQLALKEVLYFLHQMGSESFARKP